MVLLNYQTFGQPGRPALVLLHGLLGSATNWVSIARKLSVDYYVLVPDLRNHGQSPHTHSMAYTAMTQDLLALLDKENMPQATFIGHSMGGKLAMRLALLTPERIQAFAAVDIAPVTYQCSFEHFFALFERIDLTAIQNRGDAQEQMAQYNIEESMQFFLLQNLRKKNGNWEWRINLAALRAGMSDISGFDAPPGCRYTAKAWFIYGQNSDYVLPAYGATISDYFPQAAYVAIADAGHWVHVDQPACFMRALQRFLAAT